MDISLETEEYWVFEDGDWLRIHKETLRWTENRLLEDRWHWPYDTWKDAPDAARLMRRADARGCAHCSGERPLEHRGRP